MIKDCKKKFLSENCDVLLVQRAAMTFYPPGINQANILAEEGLKVVIIEGGGAADGIPDFSTGVTLLRPLAKNESISLLENMRFASFVRSILAKCSRNTVCIAYDEPAALLLSLFPFQGRVVFHFHEYPLGNIQRKAIDILRNKLIDSYMRQSAQVNMADSYRAAAFYRERKLPRYPTVIRNCPRKMSHLPVGKLRKKLLSMGITKKHILLFQGAIGVNYYADNIVTSMEYWPSDSVMVFIGPVRPLIKDVLKQEALKRGVSDRVIFLGQVSYSTLFSYTVDADIAFTMIKPVSFNFSHMAGASNKRYDAMACGIPQISNFGPGMQELIIDNGIGICVNAESPEEIGRSVADLLEKPVRLKKMSDAARKLHLSRYNYDIEFSSVRDSIVKKCREEQ